MAQGGGGGAEVNVCEGAFAFLFLLIMRKTEHCFSGRGRWLAMGIHRPSCFTVPVPCSPPNIGMYLLMAKGAIRS